MDKSKAHWQRVTERKKRDRERESQLIDSLMPKVTTSKNYPEVVFDEFVSSIICRGGAVMERSRNDNERRSNNNT